MSKSQQNQIKNINEYSKPPVIENTALIVEGGGQRGIFTAGVLDSWLAQDFNPFSLLIGTSAGAQNLSTYMTHQPGHAKQSIMRLSRHPDFLI
ncbi:patatin-like phospholipase family protein [Psychromonas sp. KJ10-10]|uniref:patatin-like phospholipase family protein n=1 Tax=Psychromonas sp. KJ10-10 TaxID=3391823 RepID=UPI0039B43C3B